MATPSLTAITPLMESLKIATNGFYLHLMLVEETFRALLNKDFKNEGENRFLEIVFLVSELVSESMKDSQRLLVALNSV